jgi:peptidylprolyl isomerase
MTAVRATRLVALGLSAAALALAGCGDDDGSSEATASSTPATTAAGASTTVRPIRNPFKRPVHQAHPGATVDQLIVRDIKVGDGETLEAGDTAIADYHGTIYESGRVFDSSWQRGREPIEIRIDNGSVIAGWWQGLPGMRVGGRRTLVIPPALGYGDMAQGPIPANSTLFFTVDLLGVRKAEPPGTAQDAAIGG